MFISGIPDNLEILGIGDILRSLVVSDIFSAYHLLSIFDCLWNLFSTNAKGIETYKLSTFSLVSERKSTCDSTQPHPTTKLRKCGTLYYSQPRLVKFLCSSERDFENSISNHIEISRFLTQKIDKTKLRDIFQQDSGFDIWILSKID